MAAEKQKLQFVAVSPDVVGKGSVRKRQKSTNRMAEIRTAVHGFQYSPSHLHPTLQKLLENQKAARKGAVKCMSELLMCLCPG